MQLNSVCAKKLLLKSEYFHSKSNCFQTPQIGISSIVCCKSDFTVISLCSSLFNSQLSHHLFSKIPTRLLWDLYIISVQNSVPLGLLWDCSVCLLEHGQIVHFPEVLFFRFYCVYKPIQQSAGLYHHAGLVFSPPVCA